MFISWRQKRFRSVLCSKRRKNQRKCTWNLETEVSRTSAGKWRERNISLWWYFCSEGTRDSLSPSPFTLLLQQNSSVLLVSLETHETLLFIISPLQTNTEDEREDLKGEEMENTFLLFSLPRIYSVSLSEIFTPCQVLLPSLSEQHLVVPDVDQNSRRVNALLLFPLLYSFWHPRVKEGEAGNL